MPTIAPTNGSMPYQPTSGDGKVMTFENRRSPQRNRLGPSQHRHVRKHKHVHDGVTENFSKC